MPEPAQSAADVRIARIVVVPCKRGENDPRCQARAKEEALAEAGAGAEWIATTMGDITAGYVSEVEIDGTVERFTDPDLETTTRRLTELARTGKRVKLLRGERLTTGGREARILLTVPASR